MKRWAAAGVLAVAAIIAVVILRPTSPLKNGFDRIETNMELGEVDQVMGRPCDPFFTSEGFPHWVDGNDLYKIPNSSFVLSWSDGADTVLVVFDDDQRVVGKEFFPGRHGMRDYRESWWDIVKALCRKLMK
jgi:hypothetical protein